MEIANEIVSNLPNLELGYLLKSRIKREQAKHYSRKGQPESLVLNTRRQALSPLRAGLRKCDNQRAQQAILQELANVYRLLGDEDTAQQYLNMRGNS